MNNDINSKVAKNIINTVGANGIPPQYGFQFFTAGLDPYLSIIDEEYLATFIKEGGSTFKMVVGTYGGGKTHFLYSVRDLAWKNNFVVSYVPLSPKQSPFHQLDLVYKAIVRGLLPPLTADELLSGYEQGIVSFIRSWFSAKYKEFIGKGFSNNELEDLLSNHLDDIHGVENLSFDKAIKSAFRALMFNEDEKFIQICQWLTGDGYDRHIHGHFGILQRIDKTTAFPMIRSLVQWVRQIGYSGLVVLLDEAERVPSLSTKQRELHLNNLREIIDECGHTAFQSVMIFYAVPDENFLEGRTQIYEALKQRLATIFDSFNPTGVRIELERLSMDPIEFLLEVGNKLKQIYEIAYDCNLDHQLSRETISLVAKSAYDQRYGDIGYKRLFVQNVIKAFHFLKNKGKAPTFEDLEL